MVHGSHLLSNRLGNFFSLLMKDVSSLEGLPVAEIGQYGLRARANTPQIAGAMGILEGESAETSQLHIYAHICSTVCFKTSLNGSQSSTANRLDCVAE